MKSFVVGFCMLCSMFDSVCMMERNMIQNSNTKEEKHISIFPLGHDCELTTTSEYPLNTLTYPKIASLRQLADMHLNDFRKLEVIQLYLGFVLITTRFPDIWEKMNAVVRGLNRYSEDNYSKLSDSEQKEINSAVRNVEDQIRGEYGKPLSSTGWF